MKPSISRTLSLSLSVGVDNQKQIIMPADMDVYRAQICADARNMSGGSIPEFYFARIAYSSEKFNSATDGFSMNLNRNLVFDSTDTPYIFYNPEPIILDRRGTDSFMVDNLFLALFHNPISTVHINVILEGFAK